MDMRELELPLVIFTVLSQTAVGMAIFAALRGNKSLVASTATSVRVPAPLQEWGMVFTLLCLGTFAAFFHLGKPLGVVRMLNNIAVSWFSREILFVGIFSGLVAFMVLLHVDKAPTFLKRLDQQLVARAAAAVGFIAVVMMGFTYAWTGLDPIHNIIPVLFFILTTFVLGAAFATYFVEGETFENVRQALKTALVTSLVVHVSVPFIWLSGGTLMRASGTNYLESPIHWFHILVMCLALYLVRNKQMPKWLPPLLLVAELAGRVGIFLLVTPSRVNIGNLY